MGNWEQSEVLYDHAAVPKVKPIIIRIALKNGNYYEYNYDDVDTIVVLKHSE